MQTVDLSIIIPVYNAEKYLRECLDSILNQTYRNIEVICVNDCSCDNSLSILEEYAQKDNRLKIVNNIVNLGPGANRNIGIKNAIGKYLTFIDADDFYLHNNCFSELMSIMKANELELLIFSNKEFDECTQEFIPDNEKRFAYPYKEKDIGHIINDNNISKFYFNIIPFPCSKIYLRDFIIKNNIYFPEGIYYEDAAFSNYISLYCKKVFISKEEYYAYRVNVSTSTTQNIIAKFDSIIAMHIDMLNFLKERELYKKHQVSFIILCMKSLFLYFLPQINDIQKSVELNLQIQDFIKKLNLSANELKKIGKKNKYVANLIAQYQNNYQKDMQEEFIFYICNIPLIKYVDMLKYKQIYFFNIIPIYKIYYKSFNHSVHYLFNKIPCLKFKNSIIFLFKFLPIGKLMKYEFFTPSFDELCNKIKIRNRK